MRLPFALLALMAVTPACIAKPLTFERPWGIIVRRADNKPLVRDALYDQMLRVGENGVPTAFLNTHTDHYKGSFDIAQDAAGCIYTAKWASEKDPRCGFTVINASGKQLLSHVGREGSSPGLVRTPMGISVDTRGHIFVADTGNDRVQEFAPDGKFITVIGKGELRLPMKVAFDRNGAMYVADSGKNRVAIFERDVDGKWLLMRTLNGNVKEPVSVIVDEKGRAFVSTNRRAGIYMFDATGKQVWVYQGTSDHPLSSPRGLAFDASGHLLVVDESTRKVWTITVPN